MNWSVGEVAKVAGVTVRALHHYDRIGLLSPGGRTAAGYRRYEEADLERLRQILLYRELGFPLEEIATVLDDPGADARAHLRRQHALLTARLERLAAMAAAIEHEMEARTMGISLTPQERFELFGDWRPEDYESEAHQRWGDTDAWRESQRRVAAHTKSDWVAIRAETEALEGRLAAAMRSGAGPQSALAMDLAEEHRAGITRWFYDCGYDTHRGLGTMYVEDPRFRAHYEAVAPGLAEFLRDAVHANADRAAER